MLAESAAGDPLYAVLEVRPAGHRRRSRARSSSSRSTSTRATCPLQTAFPIMMTNLLNWFGGTKGELREALPAGAVAEVEIPAAKDASLARYLVAPDGREFPLFAPPSATKTTVGPLDQCGVWSVIERASSLAQRRKNPPPPRRMPPPTRPVDRAGLQPGGSSRERSPAGRGAPRAPPGLAAGIAVRPIWYYLIALGASADMLGMVSLSAKVDRIDG